MIAADMKAKAERAVESSRLLQQSGDFDGACNRAYYAVFDAARAALLASNATAQSESIRTHSGLISAFSMHLEKTGMVPVTLGRAFNRLHEIRLIADYSGDPVSVDLALRAIAEAQGFVRAIRSLYFDSGSKTP